MNGSPATRVSSSVSIRTTPSIANVMPSDAFVLEESSSSSAGGSAGSAGVVGSLMRPR
ncbi:hypothetical protein MU580_01505 [Clavibacter michiganensis subsp. michiganensis]|uniref:hypothetical protein n=1 Tax=Clavibacter michiganensis TaxID=28447 RepID=UPI001FF529A9|nr:hypothetical protein [Clavibacter michiganensis]UOW03976.1 hypothetical protein MU580_01505 [Clavibacter michiganensis subsp. michiganensis]